MLDNALKLWRWPSVRRSLLLFLSIQLASSVSLGQIPTTHTTQQAATIDPATAPAVPDENARPDAAALSGSLSGFSSGSLPLPAEVPKKAASSVLSLGQAREEIRRAFIKQDYERVLTLSHEIRQRYEIEDSDNFYIVAAQLRLSDRKALENGKRSYPRLNDRPPQLPASMPAVEPKMQQTPAGDISVASATPANAIHPTALVKPPSAPGIADDSKPLDAQSTAAKPSAATAQPAVATATVKQTSPAPAKSTDRMVATAMTPRPSPVSAVEPAAPGSAALPVNFMERIFLLLVLAALMVLITLYWFVMRRRTASEPEGSLIDSLSGMNVEEKTDEDRPAERSGSPSIDWDTPPPVIRPSTGQQTETIAATDDGIGDDIFGEATVQEPARAESAATAPAQAPGATIEVDIPDDLFAVTSQPAQSATQPDQPSAIPAMNELNLDEFVFSESKKDQQTTPAPVESFQFDPRIDEYSPSDPSTPTSIHLNDLPETGFDQPNWNDSSGGISLDLSDQKDGVLKFEAPSPTPKVDDNADSFPSLATGPESAETQVGDLPEENPSESSAPVSPSEQTHTSWDDSGEQTLVMSPTEIDQARRDQSGINGDSPLTLQAFHPDETVEFMPDSHPDPEQTIPSFQTSTPENASDKEDVFSSLMETPNQATKPSTGVNEPPKSAHGGNEDLFDREMRLGLDSFMNKDWASAVHHLSVAAALRPNQTEVKDKLREARRQRKADLGI